MCCCRKVFFRIRFAWDPRLEPKILSKRSWLMPSFWKCMSTAVDCFQRSVSASNSNLPTLNALAYLWLACSFLGSSDEVRKGKLTPRVEPWSRVSDWWWWRQRDTTFYIVCGWFSWTRMQVYLLLSVVRWAWLWRCRGGGCADLWHRASWRWRRAQTACPLQPVDLEEAVMPTVCWLLQSGMLWGE